MRALCNRPVFVAGVSNRSERFAISRRVLWQASHVVHKQQNALNVLEEPEALCVSPEESVSFAVSRVRSTRY